MKGCGLGVLAAARDGDGVVQRGGGLGGEALPRTANRSRHRAAEINIYCPNQIRKNTNIK